MIPVANFGLSSLVAVAADVSQTATVVAFLTLTAVLCHVAYKLENVIVRVDTETTAGVASLATVIVSATLLAAKSSLLSTVASLIHGTIACNMSNLAAYHKYSPGTENYICSNRSLHCAFHRLEEGQIHLAEDTPGRDVQFLRSGNKTCSWEVQDNLGRDDRLL